jgi:ABC-type nitrate/sulfonate/bicarbonate transport system permease component
MGLGSDFLNGIDKWLTGHWFRIFLGFVSVGSFVVVWWAVALYLHETGNVLWPYVPYPQDVLKAFFSSFVEPVPGPEVFMGQSIAASLGRVVLGFLLALAIALPLGILMGMFRILEFLGMPTMELFRPIPPIAWVPVFMFAFRTLWGPVAIVFVGAFFPILVSVMFGVKSVDPVLTDAARALGANKRDLFRKVVLPFVAPYLMTGVKVGLGVAWMCIVAAELIPVRGGGGLGYLIWVTSDLGEFSYTYAAMLMIGILSILTTGVAGLIEQRVYKWMGMK